MCVRVCVKVGGGWVRHCRLWWFRPFQLANSPYSVTHTLTLTQTHTPAHILYWHTKSASSHGALSIQRRHTHFYTHALPLFRALSLTLSFCLRLMNGVSTLLPVLKVVRRAAREATVNFRLELRSDSNSLDQFIVNLTKPRRLSNGLG